MTVCALIRNIPVDWRKREFIRLPGIEIRDLFVGATALQEDYVPTENKEHLQRTLLRLVFNIVRPGGPSVPEVLLGEPTSRVRQAP